MIKWYEHKSENLNYLIAAKNLGKLDEIISQSDDEYLRELDSNDFEEVEYE